MAQRQIAANNNCFDCRLNQNGGSLHPRKHGFLRGCKFEIGSILGGLKPGGDSRYPVSMSFTRMAVVLPQGQRNKRLPYFSSQVELFGKERTELEHSLEDPCYRDRIGIGIALRPFDPDSNALPTRRKTFSAAVHPNSRAASPTQQDIHRVPAEACHAPPSWNGKADDPDRVPQ